MISKKGIRTLRMRPSRRPTMKDFDAIIEKAREQARACGLKRSDITKAIAKVRGRK